MKLHLRNADKKVESNSLIACLILAVLSLIVFSWTIFTPPFASVDEPAHAARAYAAVHGQTFIESNKNQPSTYVSIIKVPNWISPTFEEEGPYCFWGDRSATANCAQHNWKNETIIEKPNQFLQYFPTHAFVAGIPALLMTGEAAYYSMRVFGALLFLVVSSIYLWSCLQRKKTEHMFGIFLILTPMTISGAGTLAPLALETVSAVTFLSLLFNNLSLSSKKRNKLESFFLLFTTFTLLTARPSGIFWLTLALVVAFTPHAKNLKSKIKNNEKILFRITGLILLDLVYIYFNRSPTGSNPPVDDFHLLSFVSIELQKLGEYFNNAVGIFGMDVYLPSITYYIYAGMLFSLALGFYVDSGITRTSKFIATSLISMFALLPMAVNFLYRDTFIHFWQGRYMTPLIGILVSIFILWTRTSKSIYFLATLSTLILILGIFVSYIRYSNGVISNCCGTFVRANPEYLWQPGVFNIYWLIAFSSISIFLFGLALHSVLRTKEKI